MSAPPYALVPAKGFTQAKSRLRNHLDTAARAALAERLLRHVVEVLRAAALREVWLLTDDPAVEALARELDCGALRDVPGPLSAVVDAGLRHVEAEGARAALVCMADLPRLRTSEVVAARDALTRSELVLVGDRANAGTNLLGLRPPTRLATQFGHPNSYARHLQAGQALGLAVRVLRLPGARDDLDVPADLALL